MHRSDTEIVLQPAGAGIPLAERWLGRLALNMTAGLVGPAASLGRYRRSADQVLRAAARLSPQAGRQAVLIARPFGLEDSSRHWSAYMVLDHLAVVSLGTLRIIQALVAGQTGLPEVRIQNIKPKRDAGPEQIDRFREVAAQYGTAITTLGDLKSAARHPHPWFGPLSARGWHALAAVHNSLHRRQMDRIARQLL